MNLTPERIRELVPEGLVFGDKTIFNHHDEGWAWTWLMAPGKHGFCKLDDIEVKMLHAFLQSRLDLETARAQHDVDFKAMEIQGQLLAAKDREIAGLRSVLPGIEWVRLEIMSQGFCPECRGLEKVGHKADCKLSEAISLSPASGAGSGGV